MMRQRKETMAYLYLVRFTQDACSAAASGGRHSPS